MDSEIIGQMDVGLGEVTRQSVSFRAYMDGNGCIKISGEDGCVLRLDVPETERRNFPTLIGFRKKNLLVTMEISE